ncbi:PHP domain-containing protein [Micromonospora sp. CPCC 206060]|uniref:PHP domain-containing protein n=1 Tax=Micromonospora sp. CPCC 206060 TaxID=3122406 RepID=UPI002FF36002
MSDGTVGTRPTPVDLHLHTCASDGDDSAAVLAERCVEAGVTVAAVTDHDTLRSVPAFTAAAAGRFTVVPGCEVTTRWGEGEAHLLAYWVSGDGFAERIGRIRDSELAWWRRWVAAAQAYGVPLDWARVEREIGPDRIGYLGDYLALLLRVAGDDERFARYAGDTRRLVAELCAPGRPLHVPPPWTPTLPEAIGWVVAAGGVAVLAHPARLLPADVDPVTALGEVRAAGLAGLEVWTTWHTPAESRRLAEVCARLDLVATAGSDYHGPRVKSWARGPGLLPQAPPEPMDMVAALHARRPAWAG